MELVIRIKMDNAAFETEAGYEIGRILAKVADKMPQEKQMTLLDSNGNVCGVAAIDPRDKNASALQELDRLTRNIDLKIHPDARNLVAAMTQVIRLAIA